MVAPEPHVEQLVGARPAPDPEDGGHLRSRRDRAARGDRPASGRQPADAVGRRDREDQGRRRQRQGNRDALRDVPPDRRRRRRGRTGARRLGPRQVGGRDRHRDRQPERRDRARLRRVGAAHQRGPDDPGRAHQAGRSADDAQHGRRHADRPAQPRRLAPAAAGVADDERGAARAHRAGRRRRRRVPERATDVEPAHEKPGTATYGRRRATGCESLVARLAGLRSASRCASPWPGPRRRPRPTTRCPRRRCS